MHVCEMCLSYILTIHHQLVSIAVAFIITITYKIIRNPKSLSKCMSEPLDVTNNISYFMYSH